MSVSGGLATREREILDLLSAHRVAGIVLQSSDLTVENAAHVRALRMPVVLIDQRIEGAGRDFVGTDNRLASAMLTQHLLQLGHRRVGYIGGVPSLFTSAERLAGFRETLRGAGVAPDASLELSGDYDGATAYVATMRLLTRHDRPTAIVAANNVMALGALQAINELGFRCPDDISLASIDEVPWGGVVMPRLTAAVQDPALLGRLAAERLLARINDPAVRDEPPRDCIVPPQFKLGASSRSIGKPVAAASVEGGPMPVRDDAADPVRQS